VKRFGFVPFRSVDRRGWNKPRPFSYLRSRTPASPLSLGREEKPGKPECRREIVESGFELWVLPLMKASLLFFGLFLRRCPGIGNGCPHRPTFDLASEVPFRGLAGEKPTTGFGRQGDSSRPGQEEVRRERERAKALVASAA
jgi:hypothetical protein